MKTLRNNFETCVTKNIKIAFAGIFLSAILSSAIIAQTGFAFGPKAGLNFNSFRGSGAGRTAYPQTGEVINSNSGNIRRVNIGGIVGAGIDIKNDWSFLTLDIRYAIGFKNIVTNNSNLNIKNTGWSVALGVGEQFGHRYHNAN